MKNYWFHLKKKENTTTIKTIFKIHPLVYFFAILSILTGTYQDFIIISVLITIHELGHFLCAKYFSIETDKIILYPLGGISKIHMDISEDPKKEFCILCMGPIFQNIAYLFLIRLMNPFLVRTYHLGILLFNLLPIYPLDGGKMMSILINQFFSFKVSFKITILMSYIITIIILFLNTKLNTNMIITYILLISMIRKEELKIKFYYHKLLLEKLLRNHTYKREKIIYNFNSFDRYKRNKMKVGDTLYEEKEYLWKKYNNFEKNC